MEHGEEGHLLDAAVKKNRPKTGGSEYTVDFQAKIELLLPEDLLESILAAVV
jgi:hypothetical protein